MLNKQGITYIEITIALVISILIGFVAIGSYSNYLSNHSMISSNIKSKILYEQSLSQSMPSTKVYTTNGSNQVIPYIQFGSEEMVYLNVENGNKASVQSMKYIKHFNQEKYVIETDLPDNVLFFNSNGIPIDKNGHELNSYNIKIVNATTGIIAKTINGNYYTHLKER